MKITIVGTGYQGLVVGTCLAENGHSITYVDRESDRIEGLKQGVLPLHEPGLEELVARNIEEERLTFTSDLAEAVSECLMVFLCMSIRTAEDGFVDISNVLETAEQIAEAMDGYRIIVNKGTCPPGTAEAIEQAVRERTSHPFDVVANPDFLKEGAAVDDFMRPDRVVIGCDDVRVREIMRELYNPFLRTGRPLLLMSQRSAEMTKYATNVMLAARISLMNQLADICEAYTASISEVRDGVASDYRIGPNFLFPGIGFGGVGLPNDLASCSKLARDRGLDNDLIEAIQNVNVRRRTQFLERILNFYADGMAGKRIAIWGASFKPRTDDLQGAPALHIIDGLLDAGAQVVVFDPTAAAKVRQHYGDRVQLVPKYYAAIEEADGLVIMTEWNEFRRPDYARMAKLMRQPVIFDGRNLYTPRVMAEHGFHYFSVGRPAV